MNLDFKPSNPGKPPNPTVIVNGIGVYKGFLAKASQIDLVEQLRHVAQKAPFFSPMTPSGKVMSVKLTAAGQYGWYSDASGYRYIAQHPGGRAWPKIPELILEIWKTLAPGAPEPECCLVNYYGENTKMGLHQDKDEANFDWPVVSISLGDDALFRVGGVSRRDPTQSIWLQSGDVAVMGGTARLNFHGVDRIKFGSSNLLPRAGRINLTLRVVR